MLTVECINSMTSWGYGVLSWRLPAGPPPSDSTSVHPASSLPLTPHGSHGGGLILLRLHCVTHGTPGCYVDDRSVKADFYKSEEKGAEGGIRSATADDSTRRKGGQSPGGGQRSPKHISEALTSGSS